MKNKRFIQAMGEIDDSLLERYEKIERNLPRKKAYKSVWIKYASLAACLCILFASVFFLQQRTRNTAGSSFNAVGGGEAEMIQTEEGTNNDFGADKLPSPLYSFLNFNDYKAFLQSQNLELPFLDSTLFDAFGTLNKVDVWTFNSSDDFYVEYAYTYLENDSRDDCRVQIYSMDRFYSRFGYLLETGFVDDADMCELLPENLDHHWMRTTETEEAYAELLAKYYPNGAVPLRYRLSDQVFACHGKRQFQGFVFIFDDCVVRIQFYYTLPSYGDIICPTLKGLSFKSTSKATAEELYALWKDALK